MMERRFASIWFPYLLTDHLSRQNPLLRNIPFVLSFAVRGRMVIQSANKIATAQGIYPGMVVADARAVLPSLHVEEFNSTVAPRLLQKLALWCLRYTPVAAVNLPDGLILETSGCPHLWGGEEPYLKDLISRLEKLGYEVRAALADTVGSAWALSHYKGKSNIVAPDDHPQALQHLPAQALRLDASLSGRLAKLGLTTIGSFMHMPRSVLRRRFGSLLLLRLDQALGKTAEPLKPVQSPQPYQERLPCLEPIRTAKGIEIALKKLLHLLCARLKKEEKGLRQCTLKAYRIDGELQQIEIGTTRPSHQETHLYRLFELKTGTLKPDLGFELFLLEASVVEPLPPEQEAMWQQASGREEVIMAELLDRIAAKIGGDTIHRYLPDEHYLPERSYRHAVSLEEKTNTPWPTSSRPLYLLTRPEKVEVAVALPDYPPMLFRYKGVLHQIKKADGPERIEQPWWLKAGHYRDYYCVEDEQGARYWLFRSGHYYNREPEWFLHGFFA